ncbi:MAG: glycosyltransferase family 2 protein [Candidatus Nitrohelix vancouverensis]|uniref:Glycosyltransferase family 2 protein n=1 Tax=Candidatus Nitrohelix vancouverensis TaxID=2705534 RepID=A0A7T0BZZ0_9BACT|nr:MAG: glycosyltransferase family 2 protein [Candidatus Nitrohelix vancouverensis]
MILGKKVIVVFPAYNAEKTLEQTYGELPHEYVDEVILVDDHSKDDTSKLSRDLGLKTITHPHNRGYGGNQKTCYREALALGADIVIMVHPDYQYSPKLTTAMGALIASGEYDMALGSRIIGGNVLSGGMPLYKYIANRCLTLFQNLLLGAKLSEYHTGFRAFSREVLETLPLEENSDDFIFDNEMILQAHYFGFQIGELSCPTKYFEEASSINFQRSVIYGLGVVSRTLQLLLHKWGFLPNRLFNKEGKRLTGSAES